MRWPLLAVVLLATACSEDVDGGPSFGSGASGASASGGTSTATPDDGSGATSDIPGSSADTGDAPGTTTDVSGATTDDPSASNESSSGADPTTGGLSGETTTDDTAASSGGTPLDPNLDVPEDGESCTTPGSLNECPGIAVCRFYTAEESRCESCDNCGNLGAPCTEGTDCDILFACYAGRCTNICPLGTSYCGPVEDCLDVGHPSHGVCDPFA